MSRLKLTVKELKELLDGVPDNYPVIIPCVDLENADNICGFRYVRKMAILHNKADWIGSDDDPDVFYLGASTSNSDKTIQQQLDRSDYEHIKAEEMEIYELKVNC